MILRPETKQSTFLRRQFGQLICQIWAETLVYVRQGEKPFLIEELDALAKAEQREAMESDEREGLVRLYLDTLLPEDWDNMDVFERRNYLSGTDFGEVKKPGTIKRTQVSNMEIWCECFGKDRSNIRRTDSNELTAILAAPSSALRCGTPPANTAELFGSATTNSKVNTSAKQPTSMRKCSKHDFLLPLMQFLTTKIASSRIAA